MALVGRTLLVLGMITAVYGAGASVYGARSGRREFASRRNPVTPA